MRRFIRQLIGLLRSAAMFPALFAAYLLQVCVMPRYPVGGVTASMVWPAIAVCTVCFGKLRAFWAGAFIGILMEAMQPTLTLVSLVAYPAIAVLCAFLFADKSQQKLEYERSLGKPGRNVSPYVRTLACAAVSVALHEVVSLVYIALGGTTLNAGHIGRSLLNVGMTTALTVPVMMLLRPLFGKPHVRRRRKKAE
ncbi:MAG: hypothetical protein IKP40_08385 [Clostridia bacterium]|nr:hypothetical protein [Clostridia bacterium]